MNFKQTHKIKNSFGESKSFWEFSLAGSGPISEVYPSVLRGAIAETIGKTARIGFDVVDFVRSINYSKIKAHFHAFRMYAEREGLKILFKPD